MTQETRRNIFRYGIAVDLVILATGVGMLVSMSPRALVAVFAAAVALTVWKGGWKGGLAALVLSMLALAFLFAPQIGARQLIELAVAGIAAGAIISAVQAPYAPVVQQSPPTSRRANVVTFAPPEVDADRARRDAEEAAAREREAAERAAQEEAHRLAEQQRRAAEEEALRRAEEERLAAEARERAEVEERNRAAEEQRRLEEALARQLAREREEAQRVLQERLEEERREAEEQLCARQEAEREAVRKAAETPKRIPPPAPSKPSVVDSLMQTFSGWFQSAEQPRTLNLKRKTTANAAPRRTSQAAPTRRVTRSEPPVRKPQLLMVERRRATADTVVPRLRQRGLEVSVVERWVDAVDEIFRMRPNAIVLDVEHPEFGKIHKTLSEKYADLPIVLSGRAAGSAPHGTRRAGFVVRPYDVEELARLAEKASTRPEDLLAEQALPRVAPNPAAPPPKPVVAAPPLPKPVAAKESDGYDVPCFSCRLPFDAVDADWCSCLTKERTLVCTNCLACFCKAPPAYKEKFWLQAPPRLFERKSSDARRQQNVLADNPPSADVKRPLVLSVEDDDDIQAIIKRVCSSLGYGFIFATNGQDGLDIAREYRPNLILSDAFMPKLDGREMCRILKEDPAFDCKMVVMTGLYTDTKYRSEALKRFHIDDYISKPVAITDLINLLQKHLEGVTGLPAQEDLHELHRQEILDEEMDEDEMEEERAADPMIELRPRPAPAPKSDAYEVCCFNCQATFDATRMEWCTCVGRDQTVVCSRCGGCFCKSPAAYKERFWMDAPPSLFERKMLGSKRQHGDRANPVPSEVKRPLILLVEDDENVQLIVKTVVTTMGFGFVVGANGQEGLSLARQYNPDLILSDAFMPKLDGREMCRLLKEDPATSRSKAIIMTGLYTDRKYRNEALDYFKVDDYVAKPLAVDDLIKLFKKHLPQEVSAN